MPVCVYDNPSTFHREAWKSGELICSISATLLESKGFNGGNWFPFELNTGESWKPGTFYGDRSAIGSAESAQI